MSLDLTTPQIIAPEFNDRLSDQLLLQPDNEYIFARWAYSAMVQEQLSGMDAAAWQLAKMQLLDGRIERGSGVPANLAEAMSAGMGGPLLLSLGVTYPDMVRMVREAKQPGEVIKINRPNFINGVTTPANRLASPTTKMISAASQTAV